MTKRTSTNKSTKKPVAAASEQAAGTANDRAAMHEGRGPKLHTPEAQLFSMENEDSPRVSWMNRFFGFIGMFAVTAGIGWIADIAINAMVSAALWATGSTLAALAVYYLGVIMMVVAVILAAPIVYDAIATGQTTALVKSSWGWIKSKFSRDEDEDEVIPPKMNGAAGKPSFAH